MTPRQFEQGAHRLAAAPEGIGRRSGRSGRLMIGLRETHDLPLARHHLGEPDRRLDRFSASRKEHSTGRPGQAARWTTGLEIIMLNRWSSRPAASRNASTRSGWACPSTENSNEGQKKEQRDVTILRSLPASEGSSSPHCSQKHPMPCREETIMPCDAPASHPLGNSREKAGSWSCDKPFTSDFEAASTIGRVLPFNTIRAAAPNMLRYVPEATAPVD